MKIEEVTLKKQAGTELGQFSKARVWLDGALVTLFLLYVLYLYDGGHMKIQYV